MHSRRPPSLRHKRVRSRNPQAAPTSTDNDSPGSVDHDKSSPRSGGTAKEHRPRKRKTTIQKRVFYGIVFVAGWYLLVKVKAWFERSRIDMTTTTTIIPPQLPLVLPGNLDNNSHRHLNPVSKRHNDTPQNDQEARRVTSPTKVVRQQQQQSVERRTSLRSVGVVPADAPLKPVTLAIPISAESKVQEQVDTNEKDMDAVPDPEVLPDAKALPDPEISSNAKVSPDQEVLLKNLYNKDPPTDDMTNWQSLVKAQSTKEEQENLLQGASMRNQLNIMKEKVRRLSGDHHPYLPNSLLE